MLSLQNWCNVVFIFTSLIKQLTSIKIKNPMKMRNKISAMAILACAFSVNSYAQSSADASTTATLVAPIAISKTEDMNFGQLAASGTAGTVILDYENGVTKTGGVKLLSAASVKTAVFDVSGEGTSGFSISIPSEITLIGSVSGSMTVDNFASDLGATSNLSGGTATIKIKATLNVPANAAAGIYSNASDLVVSVNYN